MYTLNRHSSNFYYYPNGQVYNERVGFLGPFILGGIAGGLAAPLFYNNNNCYGNNCIPANTYYSYYVPYYYR